MAGFRPVYKIFHLPFATTLAGKGGLYFRETKRRREPIKSLGWRWKDEEGLGRARERMGYLVHRSRPRAPLPYKIIYRKYLTPPHATSSVAIIMAACHPRSASTLASSLVTCST